jgi:hypothetical protein
MTDHDCIGIHRNRSWRPNLIKFILTLLNHLDWSYIYSFHTILHVCRILVSHVEGGCLLDCNAVQSGGHLHGVTTQKTDIFKFWSMFDVALNFTVALNWIPQHLVVCICSCKILVTFRSWCSVSHVGGPYCWIRCTTAARVTMPKDCTLPYVIPVLITNQIKLNSYCNKKMKTGTRREGWKALLTS